MEDAIVTELGVASFNRPDEMQQFEGRAVSALHGYNITPRRLCAGDDLDNADVLEKALAGVSAMLEHNTSGSSTVGFDVQIYKIELLGPKGNHVLEDFSTAYPGATISSDVPNGAAGKSLVVHCAANTSTVVSRPGAPFDLKFDTVQDYTHFRFHWKTSADFRQGQTMSKLFDF